MADKLSAEAAAVLPLTREQIFSRERFREAVIKGGMPQDHYAKLCAMAAVCIAMLTEGQDDAG